MRTRDNAMGRTSPSAAGVLVVRLIPMHEDWMKQ